MEMGNVPSLSRTGAGHHLLTPVIPTHQRSPTFEPSTLTTIIMRILPLLLLAFVVTFTATNVHAESKSEMQASIAKLTAQNDSLVKVTQKYANLIDTLSVMTGVHVDDLDTVKTVLELRAAARTANTDSLNQTRSRAALLQITTDSLTKEVARLRTDSLNLADQLRTAVAAQGPGTAAPTMSKTDQLMKLNGMLEQGLISKDEFLKLKAEMMAK
jgi:hypothetical protein